MPTGFFDLPREIRDQVYHHVWLDTPIIKHHNEIDGMQIIAVYKPAGLDGDGDPLPAWLLVSKQILAEGSEAFGLKGRMTIHLGEVKWQQIWDKRREDTSYIPFQCPTILPVSGAHELAITLQDMARDVQSLKMIVDGAAAAGKLRRLRIRFALQEQPWQFVDLGDLGIISPVVPQLKALHIKVDNASHNAGQELLEKAVVGEMKRFEGASLGGMVERKKRGVEEGVVFTTIWCWGFRFVREE